MSLLPRLSSLAPPLAAAVAVSGAPSLLLCRGMAGQEVPSQGGLAGQAAPTPGLGRRPSGPSTAATGSTSGLGHLGGANPDYDKKFPQGPGQPAPDRVSPLGQPDPEEQQRARTDILLTPHGYVPVRSAEEVQE